MAYGNFVLDKGYNAAGALSKYRCVKYTAAETVGPTTAITERIAGVTQFSVSAAEILKGKGASVRKSGISEVEAGAAVAVGAACGLLADGRVRTAATGDRVVGTCVGHAAGAAGERIAMEVDTNGPLSP